jgi:TetR/AcrR family transcriptional repressor of bet genes
VPKIVDHEARRAEIIEASWQVIAAEGLAGLSMRKIADAAGCTTGRLTHHFANREEIVLAALRAVYDAAGARLDRVRPSLPARERLLAHLEETLPLDRERLLEWKVWIAFWSAATTHPPLARENDERLAAWAAALTPLVAAAAPYADAAKESETLIGLVNGLGLQSAVHPTRENKRRARATLARHVAALPAESR